jgi:Ca2+:H+ antiporter
LLLYGVFVFVQTVRHRSYFLSKTRSGNDEEEAGATPPCLRATLLGAAPLLAALGAVLLLAKTLSPTLQAAVTAAGLPAAVVGVVIAMLVLLMLTLFVNVLTLGTGRTTVLPGAVHPVILAVFLLLAAVP